MSIPVKCPECAFRFRVDEVYAGRPGRCPECDAVIDVPEADAFGSDSPGDFRSSSRRRDDDFEDQPRPISSKPKDPTERINRWKAVSGGFRNLAIAAALIGIDTMIRAGFNLANGIPNGDERNLTSAEKALMVGNGLFTALAIILWALGRVGISRTPYLPARGSAMSSAVIAGMSAIPGVLGVLLAAIGIITAPDNPMAGMAMLQFGGCGICLFLGGWAVSDIIGLIAQIRMMKGIEASAAATWSKIHLASLISLCVLGTVGFCVLVVAVMGEAQKIQQQKQNGNAPPPPIVAPKAKLGNANNPPANANNPPANANNPPPPPFNPEDHPEMMTAIIIIFASVTIGYALLCVISSLSSQKAVRREIVRLGGGPDGLNDPWDQPHAGYSE